MSGLRVEKREWSRDIADLTPTVARAARAHKAACLREGIHIIETCTYRSANEQARLYGMGRTAPGRIVTHAPPGKSFHQYHVARDVAPVVGGKAVWDDMELWERIGELGEALGFEWGGRWKTFREAPHFQITLGMTTEEMARLSPEDIDGRIKGWYQRTGLVNTLITAEGHTRPIGVNRRKENV